MLDTSVFVGVLIPRHPILVSLRAGDEHRKIHSSVAMPVVLDVEIRHGALLRGDA
jgi:predicted nucleic acid-binding protein